MAQKYSSHSTDEQELHTTVQAACLHGAELDQMSVFSTASPTHCTGQVANSSEPYFICNTGLKCIVINCRQREIKSPTTIRFSV